MSQPRRSPLARYGFAIAAIAVALVLSLLVQNVTPRPSLLLFVAASFAALWYGGPRPALLAMALSIPLTDYFMLPPGGQFNANLISLLWIGLYITVVGSITWLYQRRVASVGADLASSQNAVVASQETQAALKESERFARSIVDALSEHIAILDEKGTILTVNEAWRHFAESNAPQSGLISDFVGANYLGVCDQTAGVEAADARAFAANIRAVIRGERDDFALEYPCHSSTEQRWFLARVTRFKGDGPVRVVISHENITSRQVAETRQREQAEIIETVNLIGQVLAAELDMQHLVQAITDAATELSRAEFGAFFYNVTNDAGESYTLYTLAGVPREAFSGFPMPRNTHVFAPTFNGEGVVRSDDINKDPRYGQNPPYFGKPEGHLPVVSYLAVPVIARSGEVLGGLFFGHSRPGVFTEREEKLVSGIAAQAAVALDNARLHMETVKQAEQFEVTLASIGDGVIATDDAGQITFMNRVAEDLTGWPHLDAVGQPLDRVFKIVGEQDAAPVENPYAKVMRTGSIVGLANHTVLISRDGKHTPIDDSGAPIRDEHGEINGVVLVFRNIAERKRLEDGLHFLVDANTALTSSFDTQKTLEAVAQLAVPTVADLCTIHLLNDDGEIRLIAAAHRSAERLALVREMALRDDAPLFQAQVFHTGQAHLVGAVTPAMLTASAPDDDTAARLTQLDLCSTLSVPIRTSNDLIGAITFATAESRRVYDAVDQVLAEEIALRIGMALENAQLFETERTARREAELSTTRVSLLATITAAMSEAMTQDEVASVIVDEALPALGGHLGIVMLLSDDGHVLRLMGARGILQNGENYGEFPPDMNAPLPESIRTGRPIWIETLDEYRALYPDLADGVITQTGTQATVCLPLVMKGKAIGGIGLSFAQPTSFTLQDRALMVALAQQCGQAIERARLFEAEKQAREAAEKANELKLKFLGMISHELRTPLTSIKGFATSLLAPDVTFDVHDQQQFIAIIDEEADKLSELIDQLLDLTRLQAGNLRIKPEPQPVSAIVDTAKVQLDVLTKEHQLTVDLPDGLPAVNADAQRIAQVLVNLVDNAAKHAPVGSDITIRATLRPATLQIDVSDKGPGIPQDARDYVFEAFRQVESGTRREKGAGLGLAISKALVEAHGGEIWINDSAALGTTISFTLPLAT